MGNVLNRETMGPNTKKIHNWASWILTGIVFITVIAYASSRGYMAYLNVPSITSHWQTSNSVPFPTIDFCPVVPVQIIAKECELEWMDVGFASCLSSVQQSTITIESKPHNCLTFNPQGTINTSNVNELGIQVWINASQLPSDDQIMGCFVSVHPPNMSPSLQVGSSFVADAGELTEVYMGLTKLINLNGSVTMNYYTSASGASSRDKNLSNTLDVDFLFNPSGGWTVNQQYIPYTVNNWIGEVGGFTCLLSFLHIAVLWIFMAIYRQIKKEPVSIPLGSEKF